MVPCGCGASLRYSVAQDEDHLRDVRFTGESQPRRRHFSAAIRHTSVAGLIRRGGTLAWRMAGGSCAPPVAGLPCRFPLSRRTPSQLDRVPAPPGCARGSWPQHRRSREVPRRPGAAVRRGNRATPLRGPRRRLRPRRPIPATSAQKRRLGPARQRTGRAARAPGGTPAPHPPRSSC